MRKNMIAMLLCLGASSLIAENNPHKNHAHHSHHHHQAIQVPANMASPKLSVQLYKDESSGFNLDIQLENFVLESPHLEGKKQHKFLSGHAHLYINGKKIGRLYGSMHHLPGKLFKQGANEIEVSLNSHDHRAWSLGENAIAAKITINTEEKEFLVSSKSSSPLVELK